MMMLTTGLPLASAWATFMASDWMGKAVVMVLLGGSILAWAIMLTKWMEVRQWRERSREFLAAYNRETHPVTLFLRRQKFEGSPLYVIYERTCAALGDALETQKGASTDLFSEDKDGYSQKLRPVQMRAIRGLAEMTMADQVVQVEDRMTLLATAVVTAPMLGLFGTVWGVMLSFGEMATAGSALLSEVAPGISSALLTTVVGLLVAIPSGVGYNLLNESIRRLCVSLDGYTQEMMADIECRYLAE